MVASVNGLETALGPTRVGGPRTISPAGPEAIIHSSKSLDEQVSKLRPAVMNALLVVRPPGRCATSPPRATSHQRTPSTLPETSQRSSGLKATDHGPFHSGPPGSLSSWVTSLRTTS